MTDEQDPKNKISKHVTKTNVTWIGIVALLVELDVVDRILASFG